MSIITDAVLHAWQSGRKTKTNSKNWVSGNSVCCQHNGESIDKRGRGGLIIDNDNVSYSCFNCQYKASYKAGYHLNHKFKKLLKWLGLSETDIHRLSIEAMREKNRQELLGIIKVEEPKEELKVNFKPIPLPDESISFWSLLTFNELNDWKDTSKHFIDAVEYIDNRKIDMRKYDFYISEDAQYKINHRVIIPFTWKNEIIGYSARALNDSITPKYIQQVDSGYVFNIDKQEKDWQFVIVSEGIFDALAIDGVAVMKADITKQQIDIIEGLDREIIVVPDFDKTGSNLVNVAIENGWNVSFPVWGDKCKDISEAVAKYGKLFVLKSIIDSVEHSGLKIKLRSRYGSAD
jgi:hypothetical protein